MRFNKACALEDFADPELSAVIRDVCSYVTSGVSPIFPIGAEHRKDWEIGMAVRALRHFGALTPETTVLGVAAGVEDTLFYLTRHARQVFATDRYLAAGMWDNLAPMSMLLEPELAAPYPFDRNRLVVQHMDARELRYPDDTFDGIFSSGSIEHVGELIDVAHAAYEMGRVLKPGGVLSVSTELLIQGPPGGIGFPGLCLFLSPENLRRYVIEASGLQPVDELDTEITEATMETQRDIGLAIQAHQEYLKGHAEVTPELIRGSWEYPHLVMLSRGYAFCSVHLALRKTDDHPVVPNDWARPGQAVHDSVREYNLQQLRDLRPQPREAGDGVSQPAAEQSDGTGKVPGAGHGEAPPPPTATVPPLMEAVADGGRRLAAELEALGERRQIADRCLAEAENIGSEIERGLGEQAAARHRLEERIDPAGRLDAGIWPPTWTECRVERPGASGFTIVVDSDMEDFVARAYLSGIGDHLSSDLVGLMLELTRPGEWVLDIGAHLGGFALAAAAAGRAVIAVEASPLNASLLRASATRNGFTSLVVVEAVAGESPDAVTFSPNGPWGHVVPGSGGPGTVSVAGVPMANLLAELGFPRLAFIKMDVEGSEIGALRGLSTLLTSPDAPPILYEVNCHALAVLGQEPGSLLRQVADLGYTSYLAEFPRLVRTRPEDFYPQTEGDHLALKEIPDRLQSWAVEPTLTRQERIARVIADCASQNIDRRVSIGRRLAEAGPQLTGDSRIIAALMRLREDQAKAVREAVAWFDRPLPAEASAAAAGHPAHSRGAA